MTIRTPTGRECLQLYGPDDLVTAVECFAKLDYRLSRSARCVVDLGSNIGISAAYFLSRNAVLHAYLVEPLPQNCQRLVENLEPHSGRYHLDQVAVGTMDGTATFGCEPTGRYGGLGLDLADSIEVSVRDINGLLDDILTAEGWIDALKIDVEGMELPILEHLAPPILDRIGAVFAETPVAGPSLAGFAQHRWGGISVYRRNDAAGPQPPNG